MCPRFRLALIAALVLAGAACQQADDDGQGTAEPAARPTGSPVDNATADPEDLQIPQPGGELSFKVGHPSSISFYDLPTALTTDRLNAEGWNVENVAFTRTDLMAQAAAQNQVQITVSQMLDPIRSIQEGAKLAWVMDNNGGEFVLIAKNGLDDCDDLDGMRVGIHSDATTSSTATKNFLEECGVTPEILVIPGGENRVVALRNGQLDATAVQLGDWMSLDAQAPGQFHVMDTEGLYDGVSGAGYFVNTDWLQDNREVATAFLAELLKTFRMIHDDPSILEEVAAEYLPDTPPESILPTANAYLDTADAWPQNGGDDEMVRSVVEFFTAEGELQPDLDASGLIEPAVLEDALAIVTEVDDAS